MHPAFDPSALARLRAGRSEAWLDGVVGLFLREAPPRLEEAWGGGRNGDARRAARAAHVLACLAGNVGALAVRELAEAAEAEADRMAARRSSGKCAVSPGSAAPSSGKTAPAGAGSASPSGDALPVLLYDLEIALAEARSCLLAARPGAGPSRLT